jgi:hypothetical protein
MSPVSPQERLATIARTVAETAAGKAKRVATTEINQLPLKVEFRVALSALSFPL